MKLDTEEITAIAEALAPRVADILERRLSEQPEWARSIPEAAAWLDVEPHVIRDAINDGRLPAARVGRQWRIRRRDLLGIAKTE